MMWRRAKDGPGGGSASRTAGARRRAGFALIAGAVLGAGCASTGDPSMRSGPEVYTVSVQGSDGVSTDVALRRDNFISRTQLTLPRSEIFPVLTEVWAEMGLPEPQADRRSYTIQASNTVIPRRIAGERLSRYLECGSSLSGVNADTHRVRGTIRTVLEVADGTETRVITRIDVNAHPLSGNSGPPMPCSSTGVLEDRLISAIQAKTGAIRR